MNAVTKSLLFPVLLLTACTSSHIPQYTFNQKTAAPALRADMVLLKKILEANHPSLYWYTPKDSIDYYFNTAINSIQDSLTETAFRNKVAWVISKIRCGHTSVRFSNDYNKAWEKHRYPQFPLYFKTWQDSIVVLGSLVANDSIFKRGTIITAINGNSNATILDSMFRLINTDGYSDNYKSQLFSGNFPYWYKLVWGSDTAWTIRYIDTAGKEQETVVNEYSPSNHITRRQKDSLPVAKLPIPVMPTRKEVRKSKLLNERSLVIDTTINTAFMHLATFSDGRLRRFFKHSFATLKEHHIGNLVIDLRENTGGTLNSSLLLTRYLIDTAFKTGDTIAAVHKTVRYSRYIPQSYIFWWPMHLFSYKKSDGRYHNTRFENHYFQPFTRRHFNGKVYLMQGGYTFSAATMFVSYLKGQHNVTVLGEETGGGYYGTSAMHLPTIILPHSKLRVILPLYRLVLDARRTKDGRGIPPDIYVPPSSEAIKQGVDKKMIKVRELITGSATNHPN